MGEISSHGSNPLPKGLSSSRTRPKENTDRVQMPHRPLQVMSEHSQKHIESDNWFKEANQHVTSQLDGLGDDAPYLLPEDHDRGQSGDKQSSSNRLGDPVLSYMRTHDSERENEELRGIIDDLTLDIKKLKQKLRRYKERDPPRLQGDKLFDVRTYGLPRQKKRQLEQILQQFAAEISGGSRFPRERAVRKKVKHLRDNAPVSDENTRKAMVAMLFQQHLGLLAVKASHQHPTDPSSGSDTWYDLDKIISSIKNTISNIDVDFSREALKEYGAALEISADGRHVRWQTSNLIRPLTHDHVLGDQISDFPKKTMIHQKDVLGLAESKTKLLHPPDTTYTPYALKTHKNELDDDVLSVNSSGSEMSFQVPFGNGNGHAPDAGLPAHKMSHEKLTYYKNATFYIDGHGDRPDKVDFQPRKQSWVDGVGEKRKRQSSPSLSSQQQRRHSNKTPAHRFHFYPNEKDPALNLSQCSSPDVSLAEEPMTSVPEGHTAVPLELAASGVGDVTPGDNFAVHVVMKHVPVSSSDDANNKQGKDSESSRISHRPFHDVTPESDQRNGGKLFKTYVVTATHEKLAPSSLPPATCGIFSSSSSDDGGNNEEEDGEESANEMDDVYEEQAQMKLHNMPRDGLSRVGAINGESPASMQSIEKWNAQVVASLANDKENGAFNGQAF